MTPPTFMSIAMTYQTEKAVFYTVGIVFVLFLGLAIYSSIQEAKQWEAFKIAHNCVVVEKKRGTTSIGVGVGSNGTTTVMPISNPSQTAWKCDDGVTYWR